MKVGETQVRTPKVQGPSAGRLSTERIGEAPKLDSASGAASAGRDSVLDRPRWALRANDSSHRVLLYLTGPREGRLCEHELVKHNRYDFLPDLYAFVNASPAKRI